MFKAMSAASHSAGGNDGIVITAKVIPGSSRTEYAGFQGDLYILRVAAAPEKGKANKTLTEYLAKQFRIKKNDVQIQSGQTSRIKQVLLRGVTRQDVQAQFSKD